MEVGKYNKLPHYSVHGSRTNMYVWVNEDGYGTASKWIVGKKAFRLYNQLQLLYKNDRKAFVELVKHIHANNRVQRGEIS